MSVPAWFCYCIVTTNGGAILVRFTFKSKGVSGNIENDSLLDCSRTSWRLPVSIHLFILYWAI